MIEFPIFGIYEQAEVKNAERAIEAMGASILQVCSGMFVDMVSILRPIKEPKTICYTKIGFFEQSFIFS